MKVIFRADASHEIGSGHIYRLLTLSDALRSIGWNCAFACTSETLMIVPALKNKGVAILPPDAVEACDLLVIDHYGLDKDYEEQARGWAKRIAVIDDLADRSHDCDVLLDMTYGRKQNDYRDLLPDDCTVLCGTEYALLRPQFTQARPASLECRKNLNSPPRVLVSLGSTNLHDVTGTVLKALAGYQGQKLAMDVVMGSGAFAYDEVKALTQNIPLHEVVLHTDTPHMADLMMQADLAIGAGGTSSWERCCLGLPTLLVELADNQSMIADQLDQAGAVINLGRLGNFDPANFVQIMDDLLNSRETLGRMSAKASAICDGRGSERVLPWLMADKSTKGENTVRLRWLEARDEDILLNWQSEPETRRYARTSAPPTPEEHAAWLERKLADTQSFPYLILTDGLEAGHIRLDNRGAFFEVSILIDPAYYGMGIALAALELLHDLHNDKIIRAEVLPQNEASQALFQKAGYKTDQDNWYRYEQL